MVAYSFKAQFRAPIKACVKRQTIRADRKRHARPDEVLQLYTGMRTRQCQLIGRAPCLSVQPVRLDLVGGRVDVGGFLVRDLDSFAVSDGFVDWKAMVGFWQKEHPDQDVFSGFLISWGDLMEEPLG